ncbi:putative toxin-antitoxin system toxin component, PIN family [Parazoarcus communis]|uniref:putative toxin-antitoxin system toxin component, PIN family n=1 Tax=Parazoarcus communis TaxID=41977 RepID=UPI003F6F6E71
MLDSNILFSALISPHGAPDLIYRAWRAARFELVTSRAQLDEIRRASRYPKLQAVLQAAKVGVMINNLQRAHVLEQLPRHFEAEDPDDAFLLAMADAGRADYLITGDRQAGLLQRGHLGRTRILTPAAFCVEVLKP